MPASRQQFLPRTPDDLAEREWDRPDFVLVSGDAYVDHPSFAAAILGRVLEAAGFRVAILDQPPWQGAEADEAFTQFGEPRLAWLVTAGAMDSMVARYTANRKPRSTDAYSPAGITGRRPDRALLAYCAVIRRISGGRPLIIGGIEASLRRFAHYDYWSDTVRRSILLDTKADLLVYGMGEAPLLAIAERLSRAAASSANSDAADLRGIRGTMWRTGRRAELPSDAVILPAFAQVKSDPAAFYASYLAQEAHTDPLNASILIEQSEERFVVQELPSLPLDTAEFDRMLELPYTREIHPDHAAHGIPALAEVEFSLVSSRGCFGACSFCAITFHQGRHIQSRSHDSLEREARILTRRPGFKGYIHDVGGPTANFRIPSCPKQSASGSCTDRDCLGASPCPALKSDHRDYISLLRRLRAVPGVKKVFIRSGIRYDYLLADTAHGAEFLKELCEHHVSGQLKVAPEHSSDRVLRLMRKSSRAVYMEFAKQFAAVNRSLGKKQYLVPYYIAGHPGATLEDALDNALALKESGFVPDQVQDFYPTPGTLATCMYHTGMDPRTGEAIPVARGAHERALHRALLQFNHSENRALVKEALMKLGRQDLFPVLCSSPKKRT